MKRLLAASALLVLMVGLSVSPSEANLNVQVIETGQISLSADGAGARASTNTIQVDKPNLSATVRSAYLACSRTFSDLSNGDVSLGGTSVDWDLIVPNDPVFDNGWADVTDIVKPIIDAAGVGITDITIVENTALEGCALYVIFNDPLQDAANTVFLLFGGQETSGDDFAVTLAEPLDATDTAQMGLAISFGFQGSTYAPNLCGTGGQFSQIDVNGSRMTTCAGNFDDKAAAESGGNGNLITVGGIGDTPENPADPFQSSTDSDLPRVIEDELYDLSAFLGPTDTLVFVETLNPSNDDNIFAGHMYLTTAAIVGAGITLGPTFATNPVDTEHTVTATVVDDAGAPVPGVEVFFEVTAGPNAGDSGSAITDATGMASFTYFGDGGPGTDTIIAHFFDESQEQIFSNEALKEWVADGDTTPPECYLLSIDPGPPIAIQIFTQDTGSGLDTIDVLAADNAVVTIPSFTVGTTDPVIVEAGKVDETLPAMILLRVTDVDGNATECDPVLARMQIPKNRQRAVERFPGVPAFERFVTLKNAHNGVRMVAIAVNGRMAFFQRLSTNQEITRVIGAQQLGPGDGKNNIAIWAFGRPGSKVTVLISDGVGTEERLIVRPDKRRPGASRWYTGRDMTWGKRPR